VTISRVEALRFSVLMVYCSKHLFEVAAERLVGSQPFYLVLVEPAAQGSRSKFMA
jgi:hypothetical protein